MDAKFDIDHLVNEHQISKKTLHNGFKSLFGFAPGHFLRQMKLNLVHNELKESNPSQTTVSRVAQKWGFTHMGHFSDYYAELFGEVPSLTLRRDYHGDVAIIERSCVSRQEEII
jgi:AraC family ethanolamine operon transcriptional activator